jgi:hypothetical protein
MTKHSSHSKGGRALAVSKTVGRIAEGLMRPSFQKDPVSEEFIRDTILARRLRYRFFPERFFGEPAWDLLLELLLGEIEGRQVTVPNLCEAAGVPAAITLRWLNGLATEGMIMRRFDPRDSTCELIELSPSAERALRRYFHELCKRG